MERGERWDRRRARVGASLRRSGGRPAIGRRDSRDSLSDARPTPPTPLGAVLLALVTTAIGLALVKPWGPLLAARSSTDSGSASACLARGAETYPVTINVRSYRPAPSVGTDEPVSRASVAHPAIKGFRYLVALDDSADPEDDDPANEPSIRPLASSAPLLESGVVAGDTTELHLPAGCKWLVTVEAVAEPSPGQVERVSGSLERRGAVVDLRDRLGPGYTPRDADANGSVVEWIALAPVDLARAQLVANVFADTSPTNGSVDATERLGADARRAGMSGFAVTLRDVAGKVVTKNALGDPLCTEYGENGKALGTPSGRCSSKADGTIVVPDLVPGSYEITVTPPADPESAWHDGIPTAAFTGDALGRFAGAGAGSLSGKTVRAVIAPGQVRSVSWFGFVLARDLPDRPTGRIRACVAGAASFPPYESEVIVEHEPVTLGWAALTPIGDSLVYARRLADGPACPGGVVDIRGVSPGNYTLFLWDESLTRIGRSVEVSVPDDARRAPTAVPVGGDDDTGKIGLLRRAGWLSGVVFEDDGVTAGGVTLPGGAENGVRDCVDRSVPASCERAAAGRRIEIRFRDGSLKDAVVSREDGSYDFPFELSTLSRFVVATVGPEAESTGPCVYTETREKGRPGWSRSQYNPRATCARLESRLGHGYSVSQLTAAGHRSRVDWGLRPSAGSRLRIAGAVRYDTTRAAADPGMASAEDYEPGIGGVRVNLYWVGPDQKWDGGPGARSDDVLVSRYAGGWGTDSFVHPSRESQGGTGGCDILDSGGYPVFPAPATSFGLRASPACLEFRALTNQTKDGTFDGAFAFEEMCDPARGGWVDAPVSVQSPVGCGSRVPLAPGRYVVEVVVGKNAGLGVSPYEIVKEEDTNVGNATAGARESGTSSPCVGPMHVVRDARSPFDGKSRPLCTHREVTLDGASGITALDFFLFTETPIPGRIHGRITDSDRIEVRPESLMYGGPSPVAGVPVAIRDSRFRLLETVLTDEYGSFEAVVPASGRPCPSQAVVCPSVYLATVNDRVGEVTVTGSVRARGARILGKGTRFLAELSVGDRVRIAGQTRDITAIASDTSALVNQAWPRSAGERGPLEVLREAPGFDPRYGTSTLAVDVLPGRTTLVESALHPVSGPGYRDTSRPELFLVDLRNGGGSPRDPDGGLVVDHDLPATSELRDITIRGIGFGVDRASPARNGHPGYVTLIHPDGTRIELDDDAFFGGEGSPGWTDERITVRFPARVGAATLGAAPYRLVVTAPEVDPERSSASLTTSTGITIHYVESGRYDPERRYVDVTRGTDAVSSGSSTRPYRTLQYAIDRAAAEDAANRLILVAPGTYRENPVLYIPAKLQGHGPGGADDSTSGFAAEDDLRRSSPGSVIDASFFGHDPTVQRRWLEAVNRLSGMKDRGGATSAALETHAGAGITVVGGAATTETAQSGLGAPALDGFRIRGARSESAFGTGGGSGILVAARAAGFEITNNVIEGNEGTDGGGVVVGLAHTSAGSPDNDNRGIEIALNRIVANGGLHGAGGIALFDGADRYTIEQNTISSNYSSTAGGAISHAGRSPGGRITNNLLALNAAAGRGGGVSIADETAGEGASSGSGAVIVERNVFSGNRASEDGGALAVVGAVDTSKDSAAGDRVTIENNQITNNVAGGAGGALSLRDSPNVWVVNNTIAQNLSAASCEACGAGSRHSGGIASWPHSDRLSRLLPKDAAVFSSPVVLNDLFSGNASYRFDPAALPGLQGLQALGISETGDFEVVGRSDLRFKPQYSVLSAPYESSPGGASSNRTLLPGRESPFRRPTESALDVGIDTVTGRAMVVVADRPDPAFGEPDESGDYHLCYPRLASGAPRVSCSAAPVDDGAASVPASAFEGTVVPAVTTTVRAPVLDIDGDRRPVDLGRRASSAPGVKSMYDIGADEALDAPQLAARSRADQPRHQRKASSRAEKPRPRAKVPRSEKPEPIVSTSRDEDSDPTPVPSLDSFLTMPVGDPEPEGLPEAQLEQVHEPPAPTTPPPGAT